VDCSQVKCAALTFDDGPGPHLAALLEVLEQKNTKATFFFQGPWVAKYPELVKATAEQGHAVGTHAWSHTRMTDQKPKDACGNAARGQRSIVDAGLEAPAMLRPPYGSLNDGAIAACPTFQFVLWNVDTEDWLTKDEAKIVGHVKKDTKPGSIILMHETVEANLTAVPKSIDWLCSKGYTLVTVPELFGGDVPRGQRIFKGPAPG